MNWIAEAMEYVASVIANAIEKANRLDIIPCIESSMEGRFACGAVRL